MAKKKQDKRQTIGESGLDTTYASVSVKDYDTIDNALDRLEFVRSALSDCTRLEGDRAFNGLDQILWDVISSIRDVLADMA